MRGVEKKDCAFFALCASWLLAPMDCIITLQPHSEDKGVVFFGVLFGTPVWVWSNKLVWRTRRLRCVAIVAVWFASVMKGHPLRAVGCACTSESISTCQGISGLVTAYVSTSHTQFQVCQAVVCTLCVICEQAKWLAPVC